MSNYTKPDNMQLNQPNPAACTTHVHAHSCTHRSQICTHVSTHKHTRTHSQTCSTVCTPAHHTRGQSWSCPCTLAHMHSLMCTRSHVPTHALTLIYAFTHAHAPMHSHSHAVTHTVTYTCTHMPTLAHTCTRTHAFTLAHACRFTHIYLPEVTQVFSNVVRRDSTCVRNILCTTSIFQSDGETPDSTPSKSLLFVVLLACRTTSPACPTPESGSPHGPHGAGTRSSFRRETPAWRGPGPRGGLSAVPPQRAARGVTEHIRVSDEREQPHSRPQRA